MKSSLTFLFALFAVASAQERELSGSGPSLASGSFKGPSLLSGSFGGPTLGSASGPTLKSATAVGPTLKSAGGFGPTLKSGKAASLKSAAVVLVNNIPVVVPAVNFKSRVRRNLAVDAEN